MGLDTQESFHDLGLHQIDIQSCDVSEEWKKKIVNLVGKYESIFSRDRLDCGEVKDVVHRIRLKDEKPFRLPYRRVPPSQFQKLKQTLDEMKEKGIISKSSSE